MADADSNPMRRRTFIQKGAAATVAATALTPVASLAQDNTPGSPKPLEIPKRMLGKTGVQVTILNGGTARAPGALDRMLRFEYSHGVRFFDTAASYGTEDAFKQWFAAMPEVRPRIFLATKDGVARPSDMIKRIDLRLEALGTDYIDLLYFHALSGKAVDYGLTGNEMEWPKSKEMKEAIDAIKKTGKVRFVGFATHDQRRAEQLEIAAEGGLMDVVMVAMNPWLEKDSRLNRAIDACYEKKIGVVAMKVVAGHLGLSGFERNLKQLRLQAPVLKQRGLNPYQGILQAIWSDERIAAACVSMANTDQVSQNSDAARRFEPMNPSEIHGLRAALLDAGPIMCAACDGRCGRAAGTAARLADLTRFLTYHEHHGACRWAREAYSLLTEEERNWHGADLDAARAACPTKLNFAQLLPEVDRLLG
ncbi:aldo/keto reductase [Singulisphaera sp. Ch08]|uniref:Aldo/keto reductase n=1 Tax=Singulisphaera sp. Ch08 TaxID=3120278 RepID=A0AAU7CAS5_9BACT